MKNIINLNLIIFFTTLFFQQSIAQHISPEGYWKSSTGNRFFVANTDSGIVYKNTGTGDVFEATYTGSNQYSLYMYEYGVISDILTLTVVNRNTMVGTYLYSSRKVKWKNENNSYRQNQSYSNTASNNTYKTQQFEREIQNLNGKIRRTKQQLANYTGSNFGVKQSYQNLINQYENQISQYRRTINSLR